MSHTHTHTPQILEKESWDQVADSLESQTQGFALFFGRSGAITEKGAEHTEGRGVGKAI